MSSPLPRVLVVASLLVLALGLPAQPAHAQQPAAGIEQGLAPAQLHAAGLDTLTPAQLQALNALIDARTAQSVAAARASDPAFAKDADAVPVGAGAPHAAPSTTRAAGQGAPDMGGSFIGLNDKPIHSRLKGSISSWEPGTEFVLENGQVWKVLKGFYRIRKPMQSPDIVVVPGVAGRWFLQVDEDFPKARVYRID